ncbi:MAG: hypothetical protein IPH72_27245 [Sandaracinaceae bacterium]|nr:hypothetical protein [Sandaracinaceae bacterium]
MSIAPATLAGLRQRDHLRGLRRHQARCSAAELRGKCRHWFIHGCAPQTHQVTTCPSSDLCCLEDWPVGAGRRVPHPTAIFIHAFNTEPWGPSAG